MSAKPRGMRTKKIVFLGLAACGLAVCGFAAFLAIRVIGAIHKVAPAAGLLDVVSVVRNDPLPTATAAAGFGRVNFLLLGYGGAGHDGPYLTDSMMVVSAQTDTHQLAMVSIPRDIWIPIPTNRYGLNWTTKINGAYTIGARDDIFPYKDPPYRGALGGGNLSAEMVHWVTGLPIPYWVAVDFEGFRKAVDAVGGIDVNVPRALDDREYPVDETDGYTHVHFDAGWQHMDGARALQFARLRHTEGGDFDRSRRQQLILLAVRSRVLGIGGIPRLLGLMDVLQDHFRTNMNLQQVRTFADVVSRLQDNRAARVSIDDTNFLYDAISTDGQDILLPYDPNYAGLHRYLDLVFPDPEVAVEAASVKLLNGTTSYGTWRSMADLVSQLLSWAGVTTVAPADAPRRNYVRSEVHDYSNGANPATVAYLANFFNADVIPEAGPTPGDAAVVVIIGRDFGLAFSPYRPAPPRPAPLATPRPATPSPTLRPSVQATASPRPAG